GGPPWGSSAPQPPPWTAWRAAYQARPGPALSDRSRLREPAPKDRVVHACCIELPLSDRDDGDTQRETLEQRRVDEDVDALDLERDVHADPREGAVRLGAQAAVRLLVEAHVQRRAPRRAAPHER